MNISSIVIQTTADKVDLLIDELKGSSLCDYHLHDSKGRIIVTIEGKNTEEEIYKLKKIKSLEGVISAEMMYAYSEDELASLRADIEQNNTGAGWLNEDIKAEQIRYQGDLKKKDV